jgi:group I intron endonuclease
MNNKICCIYKITSPSGKIYVGQTLNFNERIYKYSVSDCKSQRKLYNSIVKYGWKNHTIEIIEECLPELLNEKERFWQEKLSCVSGGLNCVLTSTETKSGVLSEETKQKISSSNKGRKLTEEHKKKVGDGNKGKKMSEESKLKISLAHKGENAIWYGKKLSDETKNKMSKSMIGRKVSDETKKKLSELMKNRVHTKKKVIDKETCKIYSSAKEAYQQTEFSYYVFCNMLSGRTINKTNFEFIV